MKIEYLIKELTELAISYSETNQGEALSIESFFEFLDRKKGNKPNKKVLNLPHNELDQEIITHMGRLSRHANRYLKVSLENTIFTTNMDFAFTAILHQYGTMTKMELIRRMIYEKSSGMEIIKRLLRVGIIKQIKNPNDKRSKLLQITSKGEAEILRAYRNANPAAKVVSFPLSHDEKNHLLYLLGKLDDFHLIHYLEGIVEPDKILNTHDT